jgi:hypothetical protein
VWEWVNERPLGDKVGARGEAKTEKLSSGYWPVALGVRLEGVIALMKGVSGNS